MTRFLHQVVAVAVINLHCLAQRKWLSLSTVFAIALVILVLIGFLSLAAGFRHTLASAGSDSVAIVLRLGAQTEINSVVLRDQVQLLKTAPGIDRGQNGKLLVSPELFLLVDAFKKADDMKTNIALRGIGENGLDVRGSFEIVRGRMFAPGTREIVVGQALIDTIRGLTLGATVELGRQTWQIVGVFKSNGSVFESEVWADGRVVGNAFRRSGFYQTVRMRLAHPDDLSILAAFIDKEPRLKLEVRSERAYFAEQAERSSTLIERIGWPLAIFMAVGALAGVATTMFSSVEARERDIATLRAIGFGRLPAFLGTLCEAVVLATAGGALGMGAAALLLGGAKTSVMGSNIAQIVVDMNVDVAVLGQAAALALAVGLVGGLLPALRASRENVAAAFGR